ncbi:MAG: V-type ATP synthase subunit B, partial [Promethearchaeota archaeon]
PPIEVLASISRLMKDAIGERTTREDHADISSQLLSSYSSALEIRDLISVVGEDSLNLEQKELLKFANDFENKFMNQRFSENRNFSETFSIAWEVLANISKNQLYRIHQEFINKYYSEEV